MPFPEFKSEAFTSYRAESRRMVVGIVAGLTLAIGAMAALPVMAQQDADAPTMDKMEGTETAIFAGGCFWCVESDFDKVPGVLSTVSGYIGGANDNPTYKNHTSAGHREAVQITYDPDVVGYGTLLEVFWTSVDPTDEGGQFCDRGFSYTTAIYATDEAQLKAAEASSEEFAQSLDKPIVTEIVAAPTFWPAEDYHQDYHAKNPIRYNYYRRACGRDGTVGDVWGEMAYEKLNELKAGDKKS